MHDGLVVKAVAAICTLALSGCSLWLNTGERQCSSDTDCVEASLGTKCIQQVCMDTSECSGDVCDASTSSSEMGLDMKPCGSDLDCDKERPRCLNETCVDSATGDQWLCPPNDQTVRPDTVRYNFRVVDYLSRKPPKNVVAKACRNSDVGCVEPVAMFADVAETGHVQFMLPSGFFGYFEVKSSSMDTLLFVTEPIVKNTLNRDVPALTRDTVDLTATLLGYTYDQDKGLAFIEALDCSETPQGGVHFESREGGDPFYLVDQVPSKEAKMSVYDANNNTASGGFVNVPPGFVQISARVGTDGLWLGSFNAQIRARTITFIDMHF